MKRRIIIGAALLVALFAGVGIGSSGTKKTATPAATVIRTETRTATVTKAHTVAVVPTACREAIADARRVATGAAAGFQVASNWPAMMSQAAEAGAAGDATKIYALAAQLKSDNARLDADAAIVGVEASAFDAAAARCK